MPYTVTEFQTTPNPNALKCVLDRPIRDAKRGPGSFRDRASADSDPVAAALFEIPGVVNVLINGNWISVNKDPASDWKKVKAGVSLALSKIE